MFATSGDILNMSLAIGFIILVIFLSILIFYAIMILRDTAKVVDDVSEVVSKVHKTIVEQSLMLKLCLKIELGIRRRQRNLKNNLFKRELVISSLF